MPKIQRHLGQVSPLFTPICRKHRKTLIGLRLRFWVDRTGKGDCLMKYWAISAAIGLLAASSTLVAAQDLARSGTVVELYTSQGCSACPPADEFLRKLAADPDVIALALHVDYWDYIGWSDHFAKAHFTERQKAYAHLVGSNTIYTPQMIVGGRDQVAGSDPEQVERAIRRDQRAPRAVQLQLMRQGNQVVIVAEASPPLSAPVQVQLVRYHPLASVDIEYGENAGRVLDYANIVTDWDSLGQWDGVSALHLTAPVSGDDPVVVILQAEGPGEILAAAQIK